MKHKICVVIINIIDEESSTYCYEFWKQICFDLSRTIISRQPPGDRGGYNLRDGCEGNSIRK